MSIAQTIEAKVTAALSPSYLEIQNESHMHAGPAQDSHFKLIAVSDEFSSLSLVKRHQFIYKLLKDELDGEVHALALHLYDLDEWRKQEEAVPSSPNCAGKNKDK